MSGDAKTITRVLALAVFGAVLVALAWLATQGDALAFADVAETSYATAAAQ